jgi:hypothetical protein
VNAKKNVGWQVGDQKCTSHHKYVIKKVAGACQNFLIRQEGEGARGARGLNRKIQHSIQYYFFQYPLVACPQPGADLSTFSKACLSMVFISWLLYPLFYSIRYFCHFLNLCLRISGFIMILSSLVLHCSATGPGLDGSKLANSIVAVTQYCLGAVSCL